jgi:hypothetical protein
MADKEFRSEVRQSLERAFAEDHSVDNAAVELKTLRMASNVPLSRVREGVVSAIVEKIPVVEEAAKQRVEVQRTIGRWGELINRIGGVDAVETVTLLQVGFFSCFKGMKPRTDYSDLLAETLCLLIPDASLRSNPGSTLPN